MEKNYTVIKAYECENEDPIRLIQGDTVQVGERSNDDGPWPNWIYCISDRTKKEGWTPIQLLEIKDKVGIAIMDYDAKEMTVYEGDKLEGSTKLNGWIWCRRCSNQEEGWVPKECLK